MAGVIVASLSLRGIVFHGLLSFFTLAPLSGCQDGLRLSYTWDVDLSGVQRGVLPFMKALPP